jgi:hypothetical protein
MVDPHLLLDTPMSPIGFARPVLAASVVGAVAVVAAVATLFSATPETRRQTIAPTRTEAKSCEALLCSWDDFLPTTTTATVSQTFGPPGLLSLGSFTDCIGCIAIEGSAFSPRGFAFGLAKLNGNGGAPGLVVSEAARAAGGSNGSAPSPGGPSGAEGVGLEVASSVTSSGTPPVTGAAAAAAAAVTATTDVPVTTNPEPGTVALLATGLLVLVPVIRKQRRA